MSKPKPGSYADLIDLPDDPVEAHAQAVAAPVAPAVDPALAVDPDQEKAADPFEGMSPEEMGAVANAAIRADMERRDRERAEYNAARARGENPPLPPGVIDGRRRRKVETVAESAPAPVAVVAPETRAEPVSPAKAEPPKPAAARRASGVPSRREAARLRRLEPKPEPADYAQRSLYAREETFERFRQLAFSNKTTAQALYREGMFLLLQKYGQADGLTLDDM